MIEQTVIASPIKPLLIAGNDEGITEISFHTQDLPTNDYADLHPVLLEAIQQLKAYFKGTLKHFSLPLNPQGTPFQQRVWKGLLQIPYGKTLSYSAFAQQLGDIKAIRAVASANGKNPISIVIPCHRVIGKDGSLTGYGGGLWRKEWLLTHEGVLPPSLF